MNRDIDSQKEILVTYGAMEGLYCAILGFINKGDEVILIEPYFTCYLPMIEEAGGVARFVTLRPVQFFCILIPYHNILIRIVTEPK